MSWDVILLEEVEAWYFSLDDEAMAAVTGAIDLLELEGPTLGRPTVEQGKGIEVPQLEGAAAGGYQHSDPVHLRSTTAGDPAAWRGQGRQLEALVRGEHSGGRSAI